MKRTATIVALVVVLATAPAWGKGKRPHEGPPREKPVPEQPRERATRGETEVATWAWWAEWAGYAYVGPFWSEPECRASLVRLPKFVRCVARRF